MTALLTLALLSLFTPFKIVTGLVQLRPFDVLCVVMTAWLLTKGRLVPRYGIPFGLGVVLPYFALHVASAFTVSQSNGIREALQVGLCLLFAWVVASSAPLVDYRRLTHLAVIGLVAVTVFSIAWHISQGYWTGWKRLGDPKAAFTFLPLVLGALLVIDPPEAKRRLLFLWTATGAVILMSGERKALLVYLVLSAILFARGRILRLVPVVIVGVGALTMLASTVDDPYLARQLGSLVNPMSTGDYDSAMATGTVAEGDTLSNAQRSFVLSYGRELLEQSPLFGAGTNRYSMLIDERFYYLPEFLRAGIHGEFLRITIENGIVGLLLYVIAWVTAFERGRRTIHLALPGQRRRDPRRGILLAVLFIPCLAYVSFEASGTHSFVPLILLSLMPDLLTVQAVVRAGYAAFVLRPGLA